MDEANTISIVRRYAEEWHVENVTSFRIEPRRKMFRTIAHFVHHDSDDWLGFAFVESNATVPSTFDFRPKRQGLMMPPLWAAFPSYSAVTIGWRMGDGEDYRDAWSKWYAQLSKSQRTDYQLMFPVPIDDRCWNLWFYDVDGAAAP